MWFLHLLFLHVTLLFLHATFLSNILFYALFFSVWYYDFFVQHSFLAIFLGIFGRNSYNIIECNNESVTQQNAFVGTIFWKLFLAHSISNVFLMNWINYVFMIIIISLSFHAFKKVQEISNTPSDIKHDLKGKGKHKALNQSSSQIKETQLGICKIHGFGEIQNVRSIWRH